MPFVDLHCDTIARLLACRRAGLPGQLRTGEGAHVTLEKLQRSGYLLQNFALFVNLQGETPPPGEGAGAEDLYRLSMAAGGVAVGGGFDPGGPLLDGDGGQRGPGCAGSVLSGDGAGPAGGKDCLPADRGGGGVCLGSLPLLRTLYRLGVRMLTLTWNYPNELGRPNGQPGGLTRRGFQFLEEMENLGMIPDVSHLSDDGVWDVCRAAPEALCGQSFQLPGAAPPPAQPHRCHAPALADRGCLVGVNFYAGFLGPHGTSRLADLTRHIRHMIQVGGLDLVALGSDFDGIDCPLELEDAGHMDRLVQAMEGAGFTPREIEAVCWKNAWEFYRRVL